MWFHIQGSANFTSAHVVAKCHSTDSSQKIPLCTWDIIWAITQDSEKMIETMTDLKTDSFAVLTLVLWLQSDKAHEELRYL